MLHLLARVGLFHETASGVGAKLAASVQKGRLVRRACQSAVSQRACVIKETRVAEPGLGGRLRVSAELGVGVGDAIATLVDEETARVTLDQLVVSVT